MSENAYLKWLSSTASCWWTDSAVLEEMDEAIANGATGVTTNPLLIKRSLFGNTPFWRPLLDDLKLNLTPAERTEEIIRRLTVKIAEKYQPIFESTEGVQGFVCAQVNPCIPGDTLRMLDMAKRLSEWAPNIAVKLPATAAGIDAIEECAALGITTVGTVSFSVSQAVEIARRQELGRKRAMQSGIKPGQAFSVVMVGRQDDYLRDVAQDCHANVKESDLVCAGTAVIKRAYDIIRKEGYASKLMPAGMRGAYHTAELAGADMSMSIGPAIQRQLVGTELVEQIDEPVSKDIIGRLMKIPEFVRAYEPDGMKPSEFIAYGITQKTLSQFVEAGWMPIQEFK